MPEGWRNRLLAPVYALVISFGFAVILGAALKDPTLEDLTQIRFVTAEQSGPSDLPIELQDVHVQVVTDDDKTVLLRDVQLGPSGEFTLPNPHKKIQICTISPLPGDWFAADAVSGANQVSCLVRDAQDKVEITLANDPTWIRFVIPGQPQSSELPEEFKDFKVRVDTGRDTKEIDSRTLGRSTEFRLLILDMHIRVCATPPISWVVEDAISEPNGEFCRDRDKRGDDVVSTLHRQGP